MQTNRPQIGPKWRPEIYSKLSIAQENAALRMLNVLEIKKDDHILDVGCGDGKISAKLSKIASLGSVLGIDKSSEMIDFASANYGSTEHRNLQFALQDAQKITYQESFDLVFSSFALQWLKDKAHFFRKIHKALRENGRMSIIMPLGISQELEYATKIVTESPKWCVFFKNFHPNWYFIEEEVLLSTVEDTCFEIDYSDTYIQEVNFSSLQVFEEYILLWYPYQAPLKEELKDLFFSQVMREYCKALPPGKDGTISMKIPVISFISSKASQ